MLKLDIQRFADGKVVIETNLDKKGFEQGLNKIQSLSKKGSDKITNAYTKLNSVIEKQKNELQKLKTEYGSAVLEQGKNSTKAQELKAKYEALSNSIKNNETTLKNSTSLIKDLGNEEDKTTQKTNNFKKSLEKIKDIAAKGFEITATSVGVAATAMTALIGKSVQAAGELEQQIGGTKAVFGDFADTVQNKAVGAFDKMGISANDFMATANKMGSLMQGSGLDVETSMDLSTKAMQRAADVASVMGIDVNTAMESIAGAAKSNFTMMDNLGVAMNSTTIEAYALSKGIETSYNEMDNATKVGLAMEMFLEKTSKYAGNYAKENKTFAGSFTTLKASIENFLSGAGDIDAVIDSVMNFGEILIKSIGDMAPKMVEGIIKLLNGVIPQLPTLLQRLLPVVIQGAVNLINGLVASLPTLIPVLMNGIVMAFSQIVDVLPEILQALLQATIFIINALADQMPVLIPQIIDAILEMIPVLIDNLPLFINAGWQLIIGILQGLMSAMPRITGYIPTIIKSILNYFKQLPSQMIEVGKMILQGLWKGIQSYWGGLKKNIENLGEGIVKKFKSVFGIKSPSRVFRDEIGKFLAEGMGVGFEDELSNVYNDMQRAIDMEQEKLVASVETGRVFNTIQNSTPVAISVNGNVEMDSTKVGRLITPVVSKTIKTGGGM